MKIHFLRHATFILEINGVQILVDPMLSSKDAMDPVGNAVNTFRIPMTELPLQPDALQQQLAGIDAVIVTHIHRDHWDVAAQQLLDKTLPLIIQPADEEAIRAQGFHNLLPVYTSIAFKGLMIHRTGGRHGTGEIGQKMGTVSGFVIEYNSYRLYIAGDTIWCEEVLEALNRYIPTHIVVNTGAAQFLQGGPITMTAEDIIQVCETIPAATVIAVHMNTVNHCLLKRSDLQKIVVAKKLTEKIMIPADGDLLSF